MSSPRQCRSHSQTAFDRCDRAVADASRIRVCRFCQTDARRVHHESGVPWYMPVKAEYPNSGYEVSVAFCELEIHDVLTEGMKHILPG